MDYVVNTCRSVLFVRESRSMTSEFHYFRRGYRVQENQSLHWTTGCYMKKTWALLVRSVPFLLCCCCLQ